MLSLPALVKWMNESGYAATVTPLREDPSSDRDRQLRLPGALRGGNRDIVCAFDRGMLRGMLGVADSSHRQTHALCAGDSCCRHEFDLGSDLTTSRRGALRAQRVIHKDILSFPITVS